MTVEVLKQARALISDPAKWGQGDGQSIRGTRCVALAVWDAQGSLGGTPPALTAVMRVIGAGSCKSVFDWNDAPERVHTEVLAAFDCAIANEEAKAQEFTVQPERETVCV